MDLRNSGERFGAVAQSMHWLSVALIAGAWLLGQGMDLLPRGDARAAGIGVHIALGLAVLLVVTGRFAWRLADPPPHPVSSPLGRWSEFAAEATHYALYALLAAVPLAGIAYWFARGNALPVFGLFHIATPLSADRPLAGPLRELHETLANAIVLLGGFHAAAALAHHYLLRDSTLTRMLPRSAVRAPSVRHSA